MRGSVIVKHASIASLAALALAGCAHPLQFNVPELRPPANETLTMIVPAKGEQIYECRSTVGGSAHSWAFVAPDAMLLDHQGNPMGGHGAGPYWRAHDGSRVTGVVKQRVDASRSSAIPWLLLSATPDGSGGTFGKVTSIQRVNTVGGVAPPAAACTMDKAGLIERVPYSADYYFFAAK